MRLFFAKWREEVKALGKNLWGASSWDMVQGRLGHLL